MDENQLTREWLKGRSHQELVNLVMEIADKLPKKTTLFTPEEVKMTLQNITADEFSADISEFVYLPSVPARRHANDPTKTWRIAFIPVNPDMKPLGLEIYDDIFVGREVEGIIPDLDLTDFDGEEGGVSRQHALLRPRADKLMLVDLQSTNGTFCNGHRLELGEAYDIQDKDILSFGTIHFVARIVDAPQA